jgi:aryl-alcohol dehydrogenase-like predicted oxidoreductase
VDELKRLARTRGCTPAQLALAWVLSRGDMVIPIPGTRHRKNLEDNLGALQLEMTLAELARLNAVFPADAIFGARYRPGSISSVPP